MNEHLAEIDMRLQIIEELDRSRIALIKSTHLRSFNNFDKGDRVSLQMSDLASNKFRIEGTLASPEHGIIAVKYTEEGMEEWTGNDVGLAVRTIIKRPARQDIYTFPHFVAGRQDVAYFSPDDMTLIVHRKQTVAEEHISHLALQYSRLAIDGDVIFDFTDAR